MSFYFDKAEDKYSVIIVIILLYSDIIIIIVQCGPLRKYSAVL